MVNLPDKPSEVQDVSLTVDGVSGSNSDPEPSSETNDTGTKDNTEVTQQGGNNNASGQNAADNTGGQANLMQQGSSVVTQAKSNVNPTSDGLVNQVLGQDQGMLPVVKGGAGAGLR